MIVGVIPGFGPSAGLAILLPVTFGMDPVGAIMMLAAIYYGSMYGGHDHLDPAQHGPRRKAPRSPRPSTATRWPRTAGRGLRL